MNKDLEYILNFDENKLFNTELDYKYSNIEKEREHIREAKREYYKTLKERECMYDTARACDIINVRCKDTYHQLLGALIEVVLRYSEYEWLLKYTADELKRVDNES